MGSCTSCVAHMKEISDASSNTNANADANAVSYTHLTLPTSDLV